MADFLADNIGLILGTLLGLIAVRMSSTISCTSPRVGQKSLYRAWKRLAHAYDIRWAAAGRSPSYWTWWRGLNAP